MPYHVLIVDNQRGVSRLLRSALETIEQGLNVSEVQSGEEAILAARHALYLQARERHPARWSGNTRNWTPIGAVTLNPERDSVVSEHLRSQDQQPLAA